MTDTRDTALRFMQALWAGDLDTTDAMFTPDAQWHFQRGMPQADLGLGLVWPARQALRRIVDDLFGKFDPDGFVVSVVRTIADGESVAIEYRAEGRTARGEEYRNAYVTVLTVRDGHIAEIHPYNDTAHMLRMLR